MEEPMESGAGATAPVLDPDDLIVAEGVTKVFQQGELEVHALRGVDLELHNGEFAAVAGPSGCGKTTLLNLIGALDHPTSGRVLIAGTDVSTLGKGPAADFRLDHVGFIFQAYNLVPVLTAYENAEFTLLLRGMPAAARRERVVPLLEQVGIAEMMDRRPHELSGGQQQRVAVVRALATKPRIVLADEPTANLDSAASGALLDLMLELNKELGTTFLFATHDRFVLERARRVIRMLDGRVSEDPGPP